MMTTWFILFGDKDQDTSTLSVKSIKDTVLEKCWKVALIAVAPNLPCLQPFWGLR